jgi:hypothetical protein
MEGRAQRVPPYLPVRVRATSHGRARDRVWTLEST